MTFSIHEAIFAASIAAVVLLYINFNPGAIIKKRLDILKSIGDVDKLTVELSPEDVKARKALIRLVNAEIRHFARDVDIVQDNKRYFKQACVLAGILVVIFIVAGPVSLIPNDTVRDMVIVFLQVFMLAVGALLIAVMIQSFIETSRSDYIRKKVGLSDAGSHEEGEDDAQEGYTCCP
jgi:hypothetical protein